MIFILGIYTHVCRWTNSIISHEECQMNVLRRAKQDFYSEKKIIHHLKK